MKKVLALALVAVVAAGVAQSKPDANAMAAEMQKCHVCKHIVPHMTTFGPTMSAEVVSLNDGMAIIHSIGASEHVALFHEVSGKMHAAGAELMGMSDAEADKISCDHCMQARAVLKAGATMHVGATKMGDIMAFTSDDPGVRAEIAKMEQSWRGMLEMAETAKTAEG
jgi:hypothetical protein